MAKRSKNHGANPRPNEDDRRAEQAFVRLGTILAEIAHDPDKREKKAATKIEMKK